MKLGSFVFEKNVLFVRWGLWLLALGAGTVLGLGCRKTAPDRVPIGVLIDSDQGSLRAWMRQHMEAAATAKGAQLLWRDQDDRPSQVPPGDWEIRQLQELLDAGVSAIVYRPHQHSNPQEVYRLAQNAGVPLVALDRIPPNLRAAALVRPDFRQAGRQAATEALNAVRRWNRLTIDHRLNALIVEGSPQKPEEREVTRGFYEVLDGLSYVRVVAAAPAESPADAFQLVSEALNDYAGNVQLLLIAATEYVSGALLAAQTHGVTDWLVTAGVGAGLEASRLILQGAHDFEIDLMPGERAAVAVEVARRLAENEPLHPHEMFRNGRVEVPLFRGPLRVISRENVSVMAGLWPMLYPQ